MSGNLRGKNKGVGIGRAKRQRIIDAYEGRCWICGNKPPKQIAAELEDLTYQAHDPVADFELDQ